LKKAFIDGSFKPINPKMSIKSEQVVNEPAKKNSILNVIDQLKLVMSNPE
jgi:hypothetical protein